MLNAHQNDRLGAYSTFNEHEALSAPNDYQRTDQGHIIADSQDKDKNVNPEPPATPDTSSSDRIVVLETPPQGVKRSHLWLEDKVTEKFTSEDEDSEYDDPPILHVSNYAQELQKRRRI